MEEDLKYNQITRLIIGCAMTVHNTLGYGFQEVIYQRCLNIELKNQGLQVDREVERTIFYKGLNVGSRRMDFLVEQLIMVELKAVATLDDVHLAQSINYLEAFGLEIGLLINFGAKSLEYRRLTNQHKLKNLKGFK